MLTVGEFKQELRDMAKRGTSLDAELPRAMRMAANWIEQNYTLQYMRRRITLDVAGGQDEIEMPRLRIKAIPRLGWKFDGGLVPLKRVDFDDFVGIGRSLGDYGSTTDGLPSTYTLDGLSTILLEVPAPKALTLSGWCVRYSDWPKEDSESHWLLNNAESLLRCQCMLELATFNRDDRSYTVFKAQRDEQVQVLQNADYEARYSGQEIVLGQE